MKVILTTSVPKLGHEWDVVTVKNGYARNYLLPKKMAQPATPSQIARGEKLKAERLKKLKEVIENAKGMAEQLKNIEITFKKKARGEKLYGSITDKDIVTAILEGYKVEITKEMIEIKPPIKTLGEHKIYLNLAEGVKVSVKVSVEEEK